MESSKDPNSHFYAYWVQWASKEETQGKQDPAGHETKSKDHTKESLNEVETLGPGTLCNFSLWAERNNVPSPIQSLQVPTGDMLHSLCRYSGFRFNLMGKKGAAELERQLNS